MSKIIAPICLACWFKSQGKWMPLEEGKEIYSVQQPVRWDGQQENRCTSCKQYTNDGMFTTFEELTQNVVVGIKVAYP